MQSFSDIIDDLAPTIFAVLNITLDELLNSTLKDIFYRMDGHNLKKKIFLSELENLFIVYNGYPLYSANSRKRIKIKRMLDNKIYTIKHTMSVSTAKSIAKDMQILRDLGIIK